MISDPLYAAEASNSLNELRSLFFPEAFEMVQEIEEKLLSLDQDEDASGSLANVFRLAHNLKGNAMMVDFMDLGHLTHLFENLLTEVKGRPSQASFEDISLLLRCTDSVKSLMKGLEKDPHFRSDTTELEKCLLEHLENPQSSAGVATPTDNRLAQVQPTQVEETIRVRMSRVNELIDYLDELVANHALLSMSNDNLSENVSKGLVRLSEIITQIRSTALTFRLIPVKSLFQKAQRTVRDISQSLGKEVRFITHGELWNSIKTLSISSRILSSI